jgi:hypothetical protein
MVKLLSYLEYMYLYLFQLRKEEAQVGEALERHEEVKAKWKETIEAVQEVLCCNMLHNLHSNCISSLHYIACNKCIGKWMLSLSFGK